MKAFPADFTAKKNLLKGASPVWIYKVHAAGADYYLSDNAFPVAPWGITTLKWVKSWGELQEGMGGTLDEFRISDFNFDVLIDPDAATNMETLAINYVLEASPGSLYLWFYGCTDPPQEMFRGYAKDINIPDETLVQLAIQDESLRLERAMIGTKVTLQAYPYADPDDVGKVIPIPFGTVKSLPARSVNAGAITTLPSSITAAATSFAVTSAIELFPTIVIQIDDEQILVNTLSGDTITSCTRGYNSTQAASHLKGASAWEQQSSFDYIFSSVPVAAVPKVYAVMGGRKVDITSVCTIYLGTTGNQHPSYPGMGVVTTSGYITASQSVSLLVNDGIAINDALAIVDSIAVSDNIALLNGISLSDTIAVASTLGLTDAIAIASTLGVTDTIGVLSSIAPSDAIAILNGLGISDTISVSDTIAVSEAVHNHSSTLTMMTLPLKIASTTGTLGTSLQEGPAIFTSGIPANGYSNGSFSASSSITVQPSGVGGTVGIPKRYRFNWTVQNGTSGNTQIPTFTATNGAWNTLGTQTWAAVYALTMTASIPNMSAGGGQAAVWAISMDVELDLLASDVAATVNRTGSASKTGTTGLTGTVSKSGTVTLTGGVSKTGSASLSGSVDRTGSVTLGGSVTKTGSASLSGSVTKTGGATKTGGVVRSGGVTRSGSVTLSGNSVANTLIGDQILCDVVAINTSIPAVYAFLLSAAGYPGIFQQIGIWPSYYAYNGAITEYQSALYWLNELAFQSRAWFKLSRGGAQLIYRPDTLTPVKTLATCRISGGKRVHSRKKTIYDEILNTINVLYNRDWSQSKSASAYAAVAKGTDATSIANFGPRERADLFMLDFVTDPAMAANLMTFYLIWYAIRHWLHEFDTFLYDSELEFGDAVALGFTGNVIGQLLETRLTPGNSAKSDTIDMVVVV